MEELKAIIAKVNEADPVFEQPWEADAFVTAVSLSHLGHFDWQQWVATFAEIIRSQPQLPDETAHDAYYRQWLTCLEQVLAESLLLQASEILNREEKWRQAYLKTPHGSPVELATADSEQPATEEHHHHHHHHHGEECDGHVHAQAEIRPFRVFAGKVRIPDASY